MHSSPVPSRRHAVSTLALSCFAALLLLSSPGLAQAPRPGGGGTVIVGPGGGGAGGGAIGGGGAGIGGQLPGGGGIITLPGGGIQLPGGGGGGNTAQPSIVAPRGALAGSTVTVFATLGAAGTTASTSPATFQWSISGGRFTTDPRSASVQFIADSAGTVSLGVAIGANGTSYSPTATVSIVSAETAGAITTTPMVATSSATIPASVPPAQNNDRTFRWTVSGDAAIASGQGTASITLRPGTPGLKEVVCNVTLQNLVNVPVRAYVVVTGAGAPSTVTINGGSGGGTYPAGSRVDIFAHTPAAGQVFDRWTGDVAVLGAAAIAPTLAHIVITVPATPVTLTATYKAAPAWTPTSVASFNPQTQTGANNTTTTVSTTLAYHIPANANGLVFLLHETGGSTADWFTRPEQMLLARELVAAGYGVAALNSLNRTQGTWGAQAVLANNLDALNHAAAYDRFVRDGSLAATKPIFLLGEAAGANAAVRFADLLAAATPARPVKGAVLYLSPGLDTLAVTSRVPQFFALAVNDPVLGAAGLTDARDNAQLLAGRGVANAFVANTVSPVHPDRFRALAVTASTFTATDATAVWTAVKTAGLLDTNNYLKSIPTTAAVTAALPPPYQNRAADVAAQLAVASASREFYSDANARVIAFLNNRAADAPVPPPGRLVNLSTRTKISFLGDTFALGFNISGTQRATLLIRGIGPALTKFGLASALPAPRLEVNRGNTIIASNEGWDQPAAGAATAAQITAAAASVGAFALAPGDRDTAVLLQLDPGTYTVTLRGLNGTIGDVLAEIYDVSRNGTRLTNLSTLAKITSEGDLLIPGIVIAGNNPRTLVVRAVAQGLSEFGLGADAILGDPRISILTTVNGNVQTVATNNNWAQGGAATLNAAFPAVGAFPLRAASDAALLNALAPGSYTLQAGAAPVALAPVDGPAVVTPNQTGTVLVEVYEVP